MKNRKKRLCNRCGHIVVRSLGKDYSFSCNHCDEDLYRFETYKTKKKNK